MSKENGETRIYFDGQKVLSSSTDHRGSFMTVAGAYRMWCQVLDVSHALSVKAASVEMEAATLACYEHHDGCAITGDARPRERLDRAVNRYKRLVNDGPAHPVVPVNMARAPGDAE